MNIYLFGNAYGDEYVVLSVDRDVLPEEYAEPGYELIDVGEVTQTKKPYNWPLETILWGCN